MKEGYCVKKKRGLSCGMIRLRRAWQDRKVCVWERERTIVEDEKKGGRGRQWNVLVVMLVRTKGGRSVHNSWRHTSIYNLTNEQTFNPALLSLCMYLSFSCVRSLVHTTWKCLVSREGKKSNTSFNHHSIYDRHCSSLYPRTISPAAPVCVCVQKADAEQEELGGAREMGVVVAKQDSGWIRWILRWFEIQSSSVPNNRRGTLDFV